MVDVTNTTNNTPANVGATEASQVSGVEILASSNVPVSVARSEVAEIKIIDTDIVLVLKDGSRVYIRDGAIESVTDPNFRVTFADGTTLSGQELMHNAGGSDIGRVALVSPSGDPKETVVVIREVPVAVPQAPDPLSGQAAAGNGGAGASGSTQKPWMSWAQIGTPLLGGVLAAAGGGKSGGSSTPVAPASPTILAVSNDDKLTSLEKTSGVTVSGTAQANMSVVVIWGSVQKTVTTNSLGNWTAFFAPAEIPADGSSTIIAQTTSSGLSSDPTTRPVQIDTTPPGTPVISTIAGDDIVGPTER
ncbi:MAG: hypothetical protein ORN49_01310, partial [Rhodobacteraceae bacterium]|nr:hypothetical protein [Paracoccaceae bacterium]